MIGIEDIGIVAVGHSLPEKEVATGELVADLAAAGGPGLSARAVDRATGVRTRHYARSGVCSSDLAAEAAAQALAGAGIDPSEVDVLIFAAASHDVAEPATANRLQSLTGCAGARCLDIKNACNSFLDGLDVATSFIASGRARCVLVATGEVLSPFVRTWGGDGDGMEDRLAGWTLGDAGAAAVVAGASSLPVALAVRAARFRTWGDHWAASTIMSGGSMLGRDYSRSYFSSDTAMMAELALAHLPPLVGEVLDRCGWTPDEVDLVVPHQASIRLIPRIADCVGIDRDRCIITGDRFGNTAAASIPLALWSAISEGRIVPNSRVLLVGGAAGFSAGIVALEGS